MLFVLLAGCCCCRCDYCCILKTINSIAVGDIANISKNNMRFGTCIIELSAWYEHLHWIGTVREKWHRFVSLFSPFSSDWTCIFRRIWPYTRFCWAMGWEHLRSTHTPQNIIKFNWNVLIAYIVTNQTVWHWYWDALHFGRPEVSVFDCKINKIELTEKLNGRKHRKGGSKTSNEKPLRQWKCKKKMALVTFH